MVFLWLMMGLGFPASVMHLGSLLRAFNSLHRIGASALSNEIASGAPVLRRRRLLVVAGEARQTACSSAAPAAAEHAAGRHVCAGDDPVYQIETVPTWYSGGTTTSFSDDGAERAAVRRAIIAGS